MRALPCGKFPNGTPEVQKTCQKDKPTAAVRSLPNAHTGRDAASRRPVTGDQRQNKGQETVYKGHNATGDDIRQPVRSKRKQSTRSKNTRRKGYPGYSRRVWGFCARSRNCWRDCLSFCWQKRQQDASDHNENDHIGKVPVDAVNPGFHGLNSHHRAMGDVPPSC